MIRILFFITSLVFAVITPSAFMQRVPASPGSLISIFGVEIADATGASPALPLSTQLAGTAVVLGRELSSVVVCQRGPPDQRDGSQWRPSRQQRAGGA